MRSIQIWLLEGFYYFALNDLAQGMEASSSQLTKTPQDREQELRLYKDAGLLVDTVSSSVAIFNLASAIFHNNTSDPLVQAAANAYFSSQCDSYLNGSALLLRAQSAYV